MATPTTKSNKVFVNGGKFPVRQDDGKILQLDRIIVISEDFAKFVGANYTVAAPKPREILIKKGKLAGRKIKREHSVKISGTKYELGYYQGAPVKKGATRTVAKIKWIPIHIPSDLTLRSFLRIVTTKFSKKPAFIRMPSGKSTRFVNA
jgi:hypothetical protein